MHLQNSVFEATFTQYLGRAYYCHNVVECVIAPAIC